MVNKFSNKIIFISIVAVLLIIGIGVYAYTQQIPSHGHGCDAVLVSVDGFTMTLQEAIDNGFLVEGAPSPTQDYTTEISGAYHTGNDIYVSVDGNEMNLQQAIDSSLYGSVSSSYNSNIVFGHSADEILISVDGSEMSLQDAINGGEFGITLDTFVRLIGSDDADQDFRAFPTSDNDFIVVGSTHPPGSFSAAMMVKVNSAGDLLWSRMYDGHGPPGGLIDYGRGASEVNGGYIFVGGTRSYGPNVNGDVLLIKTTSNGAFQWAKHIGDIGHDRAETVQEASDGGLILGGQTWTDMLIMKTTSNGDFQWARRIGNIPSEGGAEGSGAIQTSDGGYLVYGSTRGYGAGEYDFFIVKLDSAGNYDWAKAIGGLEYDKAYDVRQTSDGGYIAVGYTESYGSGDRDIMVIKLTSQGVLDWAKAIGESRQDIGYSVVEQADGYVIVGNTHNWGDVRPDGFAVKLDKLGDFKWAKHYGRTGVKTFETLKHIHKTSDGGLIMSNMAYRAGAYDVLLLKTYPNGDIPGCSGWVGIANPNPKIITITPIVTNVDSSTVRTQIYPQGNIPVADFSSIFPQQFNQCG